MKGTGAPTTTTAGIIGQTYFDENANAFYKCTSMTVGDTTEYTWIPVTSGSGESDGDMTLMRGPIVITTTQTVDLSKWGIQIGDPINVICVGGGGGGGWGYLDGDAAGTSNAGYGSGGDGGPGKYNSTSSKCNGAGGGGGSGYVKQLSMIVDTLSVAVTIGAAGAAGADGDDGGNGGTSSFGSYLSASGGKGGGAGANSGSGSGAAGAGGNPGSTGNVSALATSAGKGGRGVINIGTFTVGAADSGISSGKGCVMIWY